jgi:hypothetical protein
MIDRHYSVENDHIYDRHYSVENDHIYTNNVPQYK